MGKRQRQCGDDGGKTSVPVSPLTLLDKNGERVFPRSLDVAVSQSGSSNSLNAAEHAAASNAPMVIPKRVPPPPPCLGGCNCLSFLSLLLSNKVASLHRCLRFLSLPCSNNVASLHRRRLGGPRTAHLGKLPRLNSRQRSGDAHHSIASKISSC